jgi:hypothetical protein
MSSNPFAQAWRDCLQAHYMHVIRSADHVTEPTLTQVMQDVGFTEHDLTELRVRATMHVDDVGADFVPDLAILQTAETSAPVEPRIFPVPDVPIAALIEPIQELIEAPIQDEQPAEPEPPSDEVPEVEENLPPAAPDPDAPTQLSFF